jgi:hypothetical protein
VRKSIRRDVHRLLCFVEEGDVAGAAIVIRRNYCLDVVLRVDTIARYVIPVIGTATECDGKQHKTNQNGFH